MNHVMNKTGRCGRKGVTIVEVTIALIIIAIISGAAVSMMLMSVNVESNFVTVTRAELYGENVLECFRFSDNPSTFLQVLRKTGAYEYVSEENAYILEGKGLTVTVKASFSPRKLVYTAVNSHGEEIYSYTYPGEGGAS
mgnify:CR=1 FL=1